VPNLFDAVLTGLPDKTPVSLKILCGRRQHNGVVFGRRVLPVLAHKHLILSLDRKGWIKAVCQYYSFKTPGPSLA
jgi:hypothetical protein